MQLAARARIAHNKWMTNQPQGQKKTPYPNRTTASMRRASMSRESKFIGYLVLGFGVLAVIAVLILAFNVGSAPESPPQKKAETITPQQLHQALVEKPRTASKPQVQNEFFKRNPSQDMAKMDGDWQAVIGRYKAVLQIRKDVYQLILASSDPDAVRYYSSGTLRTIEDIVMLTPRTKWPKPAVAQGDETQYIILTRAPFPMVVGFNGNEMLWQNIPPGEKRVTAARNSPIFLTEPVRHVVWQKLN